MDTRQQSSFIPKKPVVEGGGGRSYKIAILPFISTFVFVLVVLSAVGIFGYNYYLRKNIASMDAELKSMQKNFRPDLIADLARIDKRIENAKEILNNHVSVSSVFGALELLTVKTVRFTSFQFSGMKAGSFELSLEGIGRSYNAVASQSDIFRGTDALKNPLFYDLALSESGDVLFKVKTVVDSSSVLYKNSVLSIGEGESSRASGFEAGAGGNATTSRDGTGDSGSLNN